MIEYITTQNVISIPNILSFTPYSIHSLIMNDWKKIYESTSPIKAQLAKAYLVEEHQIEAVIMNKQDSSYLFGLCEVYVPLKDAVLAKFLLENEGGLN